MDAALSDRYDTPLVSPDGLVKGLVRDIAVYNLHMRLGNVPEVVAEAYRSAAEMLDKASSGIFCLGLSDGPPGPEFSYRDREFTRQYMEGF